MGLGLNEASSPSSICGFALFGRLQLPGAWLWGKQSRQSLLPALCSLGVPLLHSQPHPTHVKLMSSRAHTRAALMVLTYLIKTAAFKYGGSAPGHRGALGCLWPVWTLAPLHPLTFFSSSLLLSRDFSNICVQKGRKTLFGLASFHRSFFPPFKRLV